MKIQRHLLKLPLGNSIFDLLRAVPRPRTLRGGFLRIVGWKRRAFEVIRCLPPHFFPNQAKCNVLPFVRWTLLSAFEAAWLQLWKKETVSIHSNFIYRKVKTREISFYVIYVDPSAPFLSHSVLIRPLLGHKAIKSLLFRIQEAHEFIETYCLQN